MARLLGVALAFVPILCATTAWADGPAASGTAPAPTVEEPEVPEDFDRLLLDTGRIKTPKPDKQKLTIDIHGELQFRGQVQNAFPMDVTATTLAANPGAVSDSLGQHAFFTQWVRLTPKLQYSDWFQAVIQLDLFADYVFGDTTHDVNSDRSPRDDGGDALSYVNLRWAYAQFITPIGLFRVGQQSNHWGMGILANDGDHPPFFGDYRRGNLVEQILFATKPAGKDSPFVLVLGGNLVYDDWQARLYRGDVAFQGVLAAFYDKGPNQIGLFATLRDQNTQQTAVQYAGYTDSIVAGAVDIAGHFAVPIPGSPTAYLYGAGEAAFILGSTNELRTPDQALTGSQTMIQSYGAAAVLGVVHATHRTEASEGMAESGHLPVRGSPLSPADDPQTWGDIAASVEVGYASGDSNPYDSTEHRFTFDPNHKVGLLLFDEVMRWQTARAANAATDPLLQNGARPTPGVNLLPSNGGVFGAEYVYPTVIVRPKPWLDLKAGAVIAGTTADLVDPYRLATQGNYVNYRGGDPRRHDLGLELDGGFEIRLRLERSLRLQLGAQAGVLFPGGAFADATGSIMNAPWLVMGRVGLQF
jgi:hypothetical protein